MLNLALFGGQQQFPKEITLFIASIPTSLEGSAMSYFSKEQHPQAHLFVYGFMQTGF
jgi:hypothetical protein